jgi:hypothetical protein
MIFRQFANQRTSSHSYLIASITSREAAIINPHEHDLERYFVTLAELDVRLRYTLETSTTVKSEAAAIALCERFGAQRLAPSAEGVAIAAGLVARPGATVSVGDLEIEVIEPPMPNPSEVGYRTGIYTFVGQSVLIDYNESLIVPDGEPEALLDQARPQAAPSEPAPASAPRPAPIQSFRATREGVCLERLILEDLHTSLAEGRFTPKEERIVLTYIRFMEDKALSHPSASQLSALLEDVDRTAVHVLVHNIRWKQIDIDRLPLVLAGQTSKWLKGLQTKPEFTSHEKEFLASYLKLQERNGQPPSGPEIAAELGGGRSVQWVRKRAHTIRRKQREFEMPELVLKRKSSDAGERKYETQTGVELRVVTPGCS